ncbi:MAG: dehydrogenase, short-chain alcohol dehydrogenase like protein [Chloroflexi bacterium]|nr:dehydrogenase, short-chain alcohol dehydrogenase like protein [Chloroflexota bacterium]
MVLASRSENELSHVVAEIERDGGKCLAVPTDISEESQVAHLFSRTLESFGPADILVNNAAVIEIRDFVDMDLATWEHVMGINVRGPFLCSREAFRQMIASGTKGAIVNLTSLSGVRGPEKFKGFSSYVVSKYGVLGLSEILAVEGKPHGIRVNSVAPGAVDTVMLKKAAPFLNTSTTPEDIARTILFLADNAQSHHITGANIEIFSNE